MSPDLIDASVANGAKGIVIAGVGNGNMNKASVDAAANAVKKGVVVVRSSRVVTGTVGRNVEVNDDQLGFIASDELNPQKARILLTLLLKPRSKAEIQGERAVEITQIAAVTMAAGMRVDVLAQVPLSFPTLCRSTGPGRGRRHATTQP